MQLVSLCNRFNLNRLRCWQFTRNEIKQVATSLQSLQKFKVRLPLGTALFPFDVANVRQLFRPTKLLAKKVIFTTFFYVSKGLLTAVLLRENNVRA